MNATAQSEVVMLRPLTMEDAIASTINRVDQENEERKTRAGLDYQLRRLVAVYGKDRMTQALARIEEGDL